MNIYDFLFSTEMHILSNGIPTAVFTLPQQFRISPRWLWLKSIAAMEKKKPLAKALVLLALLIAPLGRLQRFEERTSKRRRKQ